MLRNIDSDLINWRKRAGRKPVIIIGARQVGKSYTVRQLGQTAFNSDFVEINFEKRADLHLVFEQNLDVKRIIAELSIALDHTIIPGQTLLFFDEIQACPKALMCLRYFYEDLPALHVIAAGSLLEFQLKNISFPVGRVEMKYMYPLTFMEYLDAIGQSRITTAIKDRANSPLGEVVENIVYQHLNDYFIVGGLPEAVNHFVLHHDYLKVTQVQDDLLYLYKQDYKKYTPIVNAECLQDIMDQVALKIGSQIMYTKLSDRYPIAKIKQGVEVLCTAQLLYKVSNVSATALPLVTQGKQFKLIYLDIGLLVRMSKIDLKEALIRKNLYVSYQGMLAEQFVGQQLLSRHHDNLHYWSRIAPNSSAELDYIIIENGEIIPIEVKSGAKGALRSLHVFLSEHPHIHRAKIYARVKYGIDEKYEFMPLYLAGVN